jgi:hypothetical protein
MIVTSVMGEIRDQIFRNNYFNFTVVWFELMPSREKKTRRRVAFEIVINWFFLSF